MYTEREKNSFSLFFLLSLFSSNPWRMMDDVVGVKKRKETEQEAVAFFVFVAPFDLHLTFFSFKRQENVTLIMFLSISSLSCLRVSELVSGVHTLEVTHVDIHPLRCTYTPTRHMQDQMGDVSLRLSFPLLSLARAHRSLVRKKALCSRRRRRRKKSEETKERDWDVSMKEKERKTRIELIKEFQNSGLAWVDCLQNKVSWKKLESGREKRRTRSKQYDFLSSSPRLPYELARPLSFFLSPVEMTKGREKFLLFSSIAKFPGERDRWRDYPREEAKIERWRAEEEEEEIQRQKKDRDRQTDSQARLHTIRHAKGMESVRWWIDPLFEKSFFFLR